MQVRLGRIDGSEGPLGEGWAGFRVGIKGSFDDYRDSAVRGVGLNCGIATDGRLFIGTLSEDAPTASGVFDGEAMLALERRAIRFGLRTHPTGRDQRGHQEISRGIDPELVGWRLGSNLQRRPGPPVATGRAGDPRDRLGTQARHAERREHAPVVRRLASLGSKLDAYPERKLGPIMFAMHTLSKNVLKLNAMIAPVDDDAFPASLEIHDGR